MARVWSEPLTFLNAAEADAIDALAGRILPGDAADPGAREAGAVYYLDRALAGFLRDLRGFYRETLRELDAHCRASHGFGFAELAPGEQDAVCAELDARARAATGNADRLGQLFAVLREHVMEGVFCDPVYGGNRDTVGWRMIGFPGAQFSYSPEQLGQDFDASTIPIATLADLTDDDRVMRS